MDVNLRGEVLTMVSLLFVDCAASAAAADSAGTAVAALGLVAVPDSSSVDAVGGVDASMARLCISCVGRLPAASSLDILRGVVGAVRQNPNKLHNYKWTSGFGMSCLSIAADGRMTRVG